MSEVPWAAAAAAAAGPRLPRVGHNTWTHFLSISWLGSSSSSPASAPAWRGATHYLCPARPRPPPPRRLNVVINQLIVSGSVVPAPGPQSRRYGGMCEVRAGGASLPASRRPARPRPPHQLQQSSVECGVSGEQHLASASTNTASASAAH